MVTDHQPLCALYNSAHKNLPTMVARHLSKLGGYTFKLIYELGSTTPRDYASKHPAKAQTYSKEQKGELNEQEDEEHAAFIWYLFEQNSISY